jgi:NAD(P)-dependent dehydrogenase (short-subunit alcohol dehydrogenase family)
MQNPGTVLITGANGNLGSAVTQLFLSRGYRVIATVRTEKDKVELPAHPMLSVRLVDLLQEAPAHELVENAIRETGGIAAALLLVGGYAQGDISSTSAADIRKQIGLNFETAYHIVQPLFRHMMERGSGRIVFIGARPALVASAGKGSLAYGLSKSLLFKLAEYINASAKGKNVTATVVAPGTIDTPQNRQSMPDADPGKWVSPEALAEVLEFVCSEKGTPLRETVLKVYGDS